MDETAIVESGDTGLISVAMVGICGEIPSIPRDKTVTVKTDKGYSYTFKYAPLETILPIIKPIIHKYDCALIQYANDEYVVTEVRHKSGQSLRTRTRIMASGQRIADYGAALTYARRYGITLLFSLSVDEDLDADPENTTVTTEQVASFVAEIRMAFGIDIPEDERADLIYKIHRRMAGNEDLQKAVGNTLMLKAGNGEFNERQAFKDYVAMARKKSEKALPNGRAA